MACKSTTVPAASVTANIKAIEALSLISVIDAGFQTGSPEHSAGSKTEEDVDEGPACKAPTSDPEGTLMLVVTKAG
jgi:hypothetical protein